MRRRSDTPSATGVNVTTKEYARYFLGIGMLILSRTGLAIISIGCVLFVVIMLLRHNPPLAIISYFSFPVVRQSWNFFGSFLEQVSRVASRGKRTIPVRLPTVKIGCCQQGGGNPLSLSGKGTCIYFRTPHRTVRTPTVGALATAPQLRAIQPVPVGFRCLSSRRRLLRRKNMV